jgi:inorganic triphosphatase YgiF
MNAIGAEVEAKLLAERPAVLRAIARLTQLGEYGLRARATVRLHSVYLDTATFALARHGIALRVRRQGRRWEATAKWAGSSAGSLHQRPELTVPLPGPPPDPFEIPDGPLRTHLCAVLVGRPLRPILVTDIRRQLLDVVRPGAGDESPPAVAEIALDHVRLSAADGGPATDTYCEVEIERLDGRKRDVTRVAALLQGQFPLVSSPSTKFGRGLQLIGGPVQFPLPVPVVRPDDTVATAARTIVWRHLQRLRANDPGTRVGDDPEALHDFRVALRRLRAALRAFEAGFPGRFRVSLRKEFRWLGQITGAARDLDVQLANLARHAATLPEAHREGTVALRQYLTAQRVERRGALLRGLEAPRYFTLLQRLDDLVDGNLPLARTATGGRDLVAATGRRSIKRAFRRLRQRVDTVHEIPTPEELHLVRIAAKRLRYLLEFLQDLTGKNGRRVVKRVVALQDLLGAHHDAIIAAEFIRSYVDAHAAELGAADLLTLGAVAGRELQRAEEHRAAFWREWKQCVRGRTLDALQRLLRDLKAQVPAAAPAAPPPPPAPASSDTSSPGAIP